MAPSSVRQFAVRVRRLLGKRRPTRGMPPRLMRLRLEALEDRTLLSATWYVDAVAGPGGNGMSPATAFQTINDGVAAASNGARWPRRHPRPGLGEWLGVLVAGRYQP
jgi:hypothetical protein